MKLRRAEAQDRDAVIDLRERLRPYDDDTDWAVVDEPVHPLVRERPLRAEPHRPRHLLR